LTARSDAVNPALGPDKSRGGCEVRAIENLGNIEAPPFVPFAAAESVEVIERHETVPMPSQAGHDVVKHLYQAQTIRPKGRSQRFLESTV
jgi:hypothetical protein